MEVNFKYPELQLLWTLAGEIGDRAENTPDDARLSELYRNLSDVLDACEENGLITYPEVD